MLYKLLSPYNLYLFIQNVLKLWWICYEIQCIVPMFELCSIIFDRLSQNGRMFQEATTKHLNDYGEAGLRTLVLAYRKLDEAEYSAWNDEFLKAKTYSGGDREEMLERVSDMMERDLILVGATAVEDKLQKGVRILMPIEL